MSKITLGSRDRALLVSFPKCGSNWVRYAIEHFSGKATPGTRRRLLHPDAEAVIERTHFLDKQDRLLLQRYVNGGLLPSRPKPWVSRLLGDAKKGARRSYLQHSKRMVLLLRDPCELYVRINASDPLALRGFFSNILIFDRARRPKLFKHYDELVSDFDHVREILDFLEIGNRGRPFDVEEHRRRSLELYKQGPDGPASEGALLDFHFHSRDLPPATRRAIAALAVEVLGSERSERYLGRYRLGEA